jgi:hypothetical protein
MHRSDIQDSADAIRARMHDEYFVFAKWDPARLRIECIDILDPPGSEHSILNGPGELLSFQIIHVILTEFFAILHYERAPLIDEIWSYLRSHGYELYQTLPESHAPDGRLRYGDAILLSQRFKEKVLC